jgi:hypothetical protein
MVLTPCLGVCVPRTSGVQDRGGQGRWIHSPQVFPIYSRSGFVSEPGVQEVIMIDVVDTCGRGQQSPGGLELPPPMLAQLVWARVREFAFLTAPLLVSGPYTFENHWHRKMATVVAIPSQTPSSYGLE